MPEVLASYRARAILGTIITFTITSTISVVLRLISKRINRAQLGREDYVVLVAQFLLYGMASAQILDVFMGYAGHHAAETEPWRIVVSLKLLVAMQVFYASTLTLIKTSICLFYLRIFSTVKRFQIICWAVIGFIPLAFNWDQSIPGGKCANEPAAFIAVGVLDLASDVCVFALPIPMIWNLHAPMATRAALSSVFGLGLLTMVVSILRIVALVATDFADITYTEAYPLLWSFLEPAIGITVACGPLLGPLVKKTRSFASSHPSDKHNSTSEEAPFGRLPSERDSAATSELGEWPGVITKVSGPNPASYHKPSHGSEDSVGSAGIGVRTEWKSHVSHKNNI
ncbi:Satratoxin biosynthesis SC1 cluster protein [Penicillium angulare]|uniref:Satratoxin biosynthesis SC1 cluster protein n=1 Tax=Penicillium angulare TaxID=116970 RepID=UPI0025411C87|nr:Satratoxin biosynthesis SC1 cluster protein [Penicillium angulare]KAJ5287208.1 Satratoxin biosynthesis SC1 cluster protein [Penicillium angulare]